MNRRSAASHGPTWPRAKLTVLADQYGGQRFNSPNDITIDSQNRIYFSDPQYGPREGMELLDAEGRKVEGVYRIDPDGIVTRIITHEVDRPNGLIVSGDDRYLFVADNNNNTPGGARKLWRFDLQADGTVDVASQRCLFDWQTSRGPDGMVLDQQGRLYVAAGLNQPQPPHETVAPYRAGHLRADARGRVAGLRADSARRGHQLHVRRLRPQDPLRHRRRHALDAAATQTPGRLPGGH